MRALVVDDSGTIRMILRHALKRLGFDVLEASSGLEALHRLREMEMPDLVMVDWNMPEMDGLEFVRAVRSDRAYDGLPLVMVTTNNEREQVSAALEAGASEYIIKPFTNDVIREKLQLLGFFGA